MRVLLFTLLFTFLSLPVFAQFTLYHTGSEQDVETTPTPGLVLMGGATESDNAMRWFLERANGGDVVVIRTSGSDGYNDYLYSELGIDINSVTTIVFDDASASQDDEVITLLENAEAIWLAGGNQWTYYDFWNDSPVEEELLNHIDNGGVIGGTSAGMAVLGGVDYIAQFASVTSDEALSDPFSVNITLANDFVTPPFMEGVVTDTHYDNPDRKGRHIAFIARAMQDFGVYPKGIASEEYVAVCIDQYGLARVFGEYPDHEDYAYFIRARCQAPWGPEVLESDMPLTWNRDANALKVYKVPGNYAGSNTFDLTGWQSGMGGEWQTWHVVGGSLFELEETGPPLCPVNVTDISASDWKIYPNPVKDRFSVEGIREGSAYKIYSSIGRLEKAGLLYQSSNEIDVSDLNAGFYFFRSEGKVATLVIR